MAGSPRRTRAPRHAAALAAAAATAKARMLCMLCCKRSREWRGGRQPSAPMSPRPARPRLEQSFFGAQGGLVAREQQKGTGRRIPPQRPSLSQAVRDRISFTDTKLHTWILKILTDGASAARAAPTSSSSHAASRAAPGRVQRMLPPPAEEGFRRALNSSSGSPSWMRMRMHRVPGPPVGGPKLASPLAAAPQKGAAARVDTAGLP